MGVIRKRIACVCGAAIAGSASIRYQLEEFFEREGIDDVEIVCCRFRELEERMDQIDLIVSACKLFKEYPVPTVCDVNYLTGLDCEATNRKILEMLRAIPPRHVD